jgi:hypothetical protein
MTNKNLSYIGLLLKRAWEATRLRFRYTTRLKRKARVWSMVRDHGKIKHYSNYLTLLRQLIKKKVIKHLS